MNLKAVALLRDEGCTTIRAAAGRGGVAFGGNIIHVQHSLLRCKCDTVIRYVCNIVV